MFSVYLVRFAVFDESGKEYRNPMISCGITIPPLDTLKPGASIEVTGDLERYLIRNLPKSTLSIRAFYHNFESNEVIVKVEDPKGVNKKAQIELNNHFNNSINSDNWQNADFELWKDIRRYPKSAYASQMYEALILHYIFTPSYIVENVYMKEFMENHCESYNSRLIIVFYAAFLEKRKKMGKEAINERLSYWADLYKGSFASNLIEDMKPGILKGVKIVHFPSISLYLKCNKVKF